MSDSKAKLLRFPPLTHAPRWATAAPPHPDTLRALQQIVVDEQEHLAHLQVILNISPTPGPVRLRRLTRRTVLRDHVLENLRSMEYPADLTSWIDTARTLARHTSDALDDCFQSINYLRSSTQGTTAYARQLDAARRSSAYAYRYSQTLSTHFEQLLQRMAEQAGELATTESEEQSDTEPMCRITYLADVVGRF
jgi:hypothetical protein